MKKLWHYTRDINKRIQRIITPGRFLSKFHYHGYHVNYLCDPAMKFQLLILLTEMSRPL